MYRSWSTMLSFFGVGSGRSGEVVSIRSVSGVSWHRLGLDAELSEPDLSGRVVWVGFSNDHCWSCEATATSTIFSAVEEHGGANCQAVLGTPVVI